MADGPKDLPAVAADVDRRVKIPVERLREATQTLMGFRGDPLDQALTPRSLGYTSFTAGQGFGGFSGRGIFGTAPIGGGAATTEPDLTPPPTPTGLTVAAGFSSVIIQWDAPIYTQGHGHGQTNVYAVKKTAGDPTLPTFSDAQRVSDATGALTIITLPTNLGTRWHVWIKWQSADGVESNAPAGGTNGVVAQTGFIGSADLSPLAVTAAALADGAVDLLGDKIKAGATTEFGALAVGYTVTQYLLAKSGVLQNLIVDNAQISNLSAAKLTAGDGTIGGNLKSTNYVPSSSGWIVRPDGYAEFSNVVIRGAVYTGTIFANAGTIGGITIGLNDIRSSGYSPGSAGFRINADGSSEFYSVTVRGTIYGTAGQIGGITIGAGDIRSAGYAAGSAGFKINSDGSAEFYNLTARGSITATSLSATAINAVSTLNIQGNAVSVPVSATIGAWGAISVTMVITAADLPPGQTTVPVTVTGCQDVLASTFFDVGVNPSSYFTTGNILAALPPGGGVWSWTDVVFLPVGTHTIACWNHGAGNVSDSANTRNRTVSAYLSKR